METTVDKFLDGRIECAQPKKGFRAGHDTVLLAATVPAKAGEIVLELGSGAGVASLCLAARVPGVDITGIEIDPELVALANANAKRNAMGDRVRFLADDVLKANLDDALYNHVFFNPPFHPDTGQPSPSPERERAKRGFLTYWAWNALRWTKLDGTITLVTRADGFGEVERAVGAQGRSTAVTVLPLLAREREPAKRVIVQVRDGRAPTRTLAPMILHQPDGKPTDAAEAVLRHAKPILL